MTNNNFCVSSSSHTQHALSLLYRKGSWQCIQEIFHPREHWPLHFPDCMFVFLGVTEHYII
jgi:hypothetical protein